MDKKQKAIENTVFGTWAQDAYKRQITLTPQEAAAVSRRPHKKRYVGMFYFAWVGQQGERHEDVYDIEQLLKTNPKALWDPSGPPEAPLYMNYFFAEPLFGYYNMADPYILRRHIELFIAAGIDFIALDYTNGIVYENVWPLLLALLEEYRLAGWHVPQVTFFTKTRSDYVVDYIFRNIHSKNLYPELWFRGNYEKPLMIAPPDSLTAEQAAFYHVRPPQWPNEERDERAFPYMDWIRPQTVYQDVMNVSVAQHTAGAFSFSYKRMHFACGKENRGRGYSGITGCNCTADVPKCVNFIEQWNHAEAVDPDMVFVTGWNEWTALKLFSEAEPGFPLWVDTFNIEYSRDIEMTKGGYDDNYYLQLIKHVRRYKGVQPEIPCSSCRTIDVCGDPAQWEKVETVFYNIATERIERDHMGYIPKIHYKQPAPQNFIREVRVCHDWENLYFYIRTDRDITAHEDGQSNWMNLFLGVDSGLSSGCEADAAAYSWEGFQYVVNRSPADSRRTSLERSVGGYRFVSAGWLRYSCQSNVMQLSVPFAAIGLHADAFRLRFKVADSVIHPEDIMDYYVSGDTVPLGRLSYQYGNAERQSSEQQ